MTKKEMTHSVNVSIQFDHADISKLLSQHGFSNLRHSTEHDCGMTGYTRSDWVVDREGVGFETRATQALNEVVAQRLKNLIMGND